MSLFIHDNTCQQCNRVYRWQFMVPGGTSAYVLNPTIQEARRFKDYSLSKPYLTLRCICTNCGHEEFFRYHKQTDSVEHIPPESVE